MKQCISIAVLVILMCLSFFSVISHAEEPIYIGLSAPMTGKYEGYGASFKQAIELAINWNNQEGGINGRPLELVVGDSEGDPQVAKRVARKLANDDRIVAVIGDFTSSCSMAAQPIYHRSRIVQLSPTSSHPSYAPGSPYSFGIVGGQIGEGKYMARVAVETFKKKRLAVVHINNDWGLVAQKYFIEAAEKLGAEVLAVESYFEGTTDFITLLEKIRSVQPELLYICSMDKDGAAILKQLTELGRKNMLIMGVGSLYSQQLLELGGDAVEGLYSNTLFYSEYPQPRVQKFIKGYEKQYQQTPDTFAGLAYDALNLLAEVIKKAGTDRAAIREELSTVRDFPGVAGKMSFTEYGDVEKEYLLLRVKDGKFVLASEE